MRTGKSRELQYGAGRYGKQDTTATEQLARQLQASEYEEVEPTASQLAAMQSSS